MDVLRYIFLDHHTWFAYSEFSEPSLTRDSSGISAFNRKNSSQISLIVRFSILTLSFIEKSSSASFTVSKTFQANVSGYLLTIDFQVLSLFLL